jgi:hypothetical protein
MYSMLKHMLQMYQQQKIIFIYFNTARVFFGILFLMFVHIRYKNILQEWLHM